MVRLKLKCFFYISLTDALSSTTAAVNSEHESVTHVMQNQLNTILTATILKFWTVTNTGVHSVAGFIGYTELKLKHSNTTINPTFTEDILYTDTCCYHLSMRVG